MSSVTDAATADAARQGILRGVQRTSHLVEQLLTLSPLEAPGPACAVE